MWLLSTDRAELRYFARNFDAAGGYAILSHTWTGDEQTLQEVRAIGNRCRESGTNPRDDVALSPKIRNCCMLAEKNGYRWVWIDSCCIDKTSSSELSEAINSMYQWYKEAEVCYAYLADVASDCLLNAAGSAFRKSRWHTRGWTLQELIAPDILLFLSADWHELGNRAMLAELLDDITGIPSKVLTLQVRPALCSISFRMSWAQKRNTTRVEDQAYCLMGLFGVSMPTNYGEGKKAFIRLQYEIMQHDPDMSLFAFGNRIPQNIPSNLVFHPDGVPNNSWKYLMADSPLEFGSQFVYIPDLGRNAKQECPPPNESTDTSLRLFDDVELPRATVTSYGVKLRVPIYEANGFTIALILCQGGRFRHFGLFLTRDRMGKDPKRPRYFAGCHYSLRDTGAVKYVARMADLGDDLYKLTFNGMPVTASWRTVYVVPTPSNFDFENSTTPYLILNCNPNSRFRIPRWLISRLVSLQFEVKQVRNSETLQIFLFFLDRFGGVRIYLSLGSCTEHHGNNPNTPVLWAKLDVLVSYVRIDAFTHNCSQDHLNSESWAMGSRVFGDKDRAVRLCLTPSRQIPDSTLVIHLEMFGRIFEEVLREAGDSSLSLSSLTDVERSWLESVPNNPEVPSYPTQTLAPTEETPLQTSSSTPSSSSTTMLHKLFPILSRGDTMLQRSLENPTIPPMVRTHRRMPGLDAPTHDKTQTLEPACHIDHASSELTRTGGVDVSAPIQDLKTGSRETVMASVAGGSTRDNLSIAPPLSGFLDSATGAQEVNDAATLRHPSPSSSSTSTSLHIEGSLKSACNYEERLGMPGEWLP